MFPHMCGSLSCSERPSAVKVFFLLNARCKMISSDITANSCPLLSIPVGLEKSSKFVFFVFVSKLQTLEVRNNNWTDVSFKTKS